jgi:hypothetical protein
MNQNFGRLIFFLNPYDYADLIEEIFKNEYEIYPVYQLDKLELILTKYSTSILFINPDKNTNLIFNKIILKISQNPLLYEISVNIICQNENDIALDSIDIKIDNFFYINNDKKNFKLFILKFLEDNHAKGRRKHIRACLNNEDKLKFSLKINNRIYNGFITNISKKAGAFNFDEKSLNLTTDTAVTDIEFKINENNVALTGKIYRNIEDFDENPYVILFNDEVIKQNDSALIQSYIYQILQGTMKKNLENI